MTARRRIAFPLPVFPLPLFSLPLSNPSVSSYYPQVKKNPCPNCVTPVLWDGNPFRPFCSERCKLLDLGKWLNEEYRIPVADDESEGGETPQQ